MKNVENILDGRTCLKHRVSIYVPGTVNVNEKADNAEMVAQVAAILTDLFGGASTHEIGGYWKSEAAGMVEERNVIVYAYADQASYENGLGAVIRTAEHVRDKMRQEAVSVEIDGRLYFI